MKPLYLFKAVCRFFCCLTLFILLREQLFAQACLAEGIAFSSQVQIDAFPTDYPGCTHILGAVTIQETDPGNITSLKGLAGVTAIDQYLDIRENKSLRSLDGLDALTTISGRLDISSNAALTNLKGLESLSSLGESLRISANQSLRAIKALEGITSINEDLTIADNPILKSLAGLDSISTIGGYLLVRFNHALPNLEGLNAVFSIGNVLLIEHNEKLESLRGLTSINSVGSDLIIDNNTNLATLQGLNSLKSINGFLQIVNNPVLSNLDGLNALTAINGLLQIYNNPSMTSLTGIDKIDPETIKDLALIACPNLSRCAVKSICDYLATSSNLHSISDNDLRCNSRETIFGQCGTGGFSPRPKVEELGFYPNPTSGLVQVKGAPDSLTNANIRVVDSLGRLVHKERVSNKRFSLAHLPAGLYFIKFTSEEVNVVEPICRVE